MFTIYSKPACPACDQAKALLTQKGLSYSEIILDVGQPQLEGKVYIGRSDLLAKFPAARTVPQITKDEDYVGGLQELKGLLQS